MTVKPCLPKEVLFVAALWACRAHPRDGVAAHQAFLRALSDYGVRTQRLPDLVLESVNGALERSLGDPKVAARHIQEDLTPMVGWLRLNPIRAPIGLWAGAEAA